VTNQDLRIDVASRLRSLGHDFVAHELSDAQLADVKRRLDELAEVVGAAVPRQRAMSREGLANFTMVVPESDTVMKHQLFSDSVVSGGANPMGLGAVLWRDGDEAVMEVTLGSAFEGAPGRAHGGIVAALVDETMGLVNAISGVLAFTAQLDIKYVAPAPVNEPITARRHGRKHYVEARVSAGDTVVVTATALFIAMDPQKFLEHVPVERA
jgi:acyl-coenzyme A thioesterase PaaI-like protein